MLGLPRKSFDLVPARSRTAAYDLHPFAGGQLPMTILLEALNSFPDVFSLFN
jgi:hypothetical protein